MTSVRKGLYAGYTTGMRERDDLVAGRSVRVGEVTMDLLGHRTQVSPHTCRATIGCSRRHRPDPP